MNQTQEKIQQLETLVQAASGDRAKVDATNELAWELRITNPRRSLILSREAAALAETLGHRSGLAYSLRNMSFCHWRFSESDAALSKVFKALGLFELTGDRHGEASALSIMGSVCNSLGDFAAALEYHFKSLKMSREMQNRQTEAESLNNIGMVYRRLGDYASALERHFSSLAIFEESENKWGASSSLMQVGVVYHSLGDYNNALTFHFKALNIRKDIGDQWGEGASLMHIGTTYHSLGDDASALDCHFKSLRLKEEILDQRGQAASLRAIGNVYESHGDDDKALECYYGSLKIAESNLDRWGMSRTSIDLGKLYLKRKDTDKATDFLRSGLAIAVEIRSKELIYKAQLSLSEAAAQTGDYEQAWLAHKEYHRVKDEVFSEESDKKTKSLMIQFEAQRAQREADLYKQRTIELAEANDALREVGEQKSQLLLRLQQQAQELERQAREDGLTGLYNRRYFDNRILLEFERAKRFSHSMSAVMADIDFFKFVNDRFSHQVGDEVLRAVALILKQNCRSIDIIARYGGEEFAIVFLETPLVGAAEVCEKIRAAVQNFRWEDLHPDLSVTISMGLSDDLTVANHEKLLSAADAKLYEAKAKGRNQVRY
ncbi:MAG: GGDEF domain-containing protein [Rhizobacter sp.]|nr:GGDEF domain-containing protein [Chlorobiales bacterium]